MKTILNTFLVFLILILGNNLSAQTFGSATTENNISGLSSQTSTDNFLLNQGTVFATNSVTSNLNSIYISQIGDSNTAISDTKSLESDIVIAQNGSDNKAYLEVNSSNLAETIIQNGDNNSILDFSIYNAKVRNTTINQTGNNQNLSMSGANSLSEKMKISMQGQDQTIIIRNF